MHRSPPPCSRRWCGPPSAMWSWGVSSVELSAAGDRRRCTARSVTDGRRSARTFPLAFEDRPSQSPAETLNARWANGLPVSPSRGLSFDVLKYLNDDPDVRRSIRQAPAPTLWFNFQARCRLGSRSGLFSLSAAAVGDVWDPRPASATAALRRIHASSPARPASWEYSPAAVGTGPRSISDDRFRRAPPLSEVDQASRPRRRGSLVPELARGPGERRGSSHRRVAAVIWCRTRSESTRARRTRPVAHGAPPSINSVGCWHRPRVHVAELQRGSDPPWSDPGAPA